MNWINPAAIAPQDVSARFTTHKVIAFSILCCCAFINVSCLDSTPAPSKGNETHEVLNRLEKAEHKADAMKDGDQEVLSIALRSDDAKTRHRAALVIEQFGNSGAEFIDELFAAAAHPILASNYNFDSRREENDPALKKYEHGQAAKQACLTAIATVAEREDGDTTDRLSAFCEDADGRTRIVVLDLLFARPLTERSATAIERRCEDMYPFVRDAAWNHIIEFARKRVQMSKGDVAMIQDIVGQRLESAPKQWQSELRAFIE